MGAALTPRDDKSDVLKDANSDQQQGGLEADVNIDRADLDAARPDDQRDRQHAL